MGEEIKSFTHKKVNEDTMGMLDVGGGNTPNFLRGLT